MNQNSIHFDGYRPGAIGQVLCLHMNYYGSEWQFGKIFEIYCAGGMAAFFEKFDPENDMFLAAWNENGEMLGSIVLDGHDAGGAGAQVRWFIVDKAVHGRGIGRQLFEKAMEFSRSKGFAKVFLSTFEGLDASRHLYESAGFELIEKRSAADWSNNIPELIFRYQQPIDEAGEKLA